MFVPRSIAHENARRGACSYSLQDFVIQSPPGFAQRHRSFMDELAMANE
jgi:hypothetical protein